LPEEITRTVTGSLVKGEHLRVAFKRFEEPSRTRREPLDGGIKVPKKKAAKKATKKVAKKKGAKKKGAKKKARK
jgi:hypothetical protein